MLRRGLLVLAAAGVLVIPTAAPAAAPRESIGIRVLGRGPYLVLRLDPGSTVVREVAVSSTVSRPIEVPLLAVDARTISGEFRTLDETPDWLAVAPSIMHFDAVPAGQLIEEAATVTITVPSSARPGTLEAAVVAVAPPSEGGNVRVVNRVGLRVYLTIPGVSFPWRAVVIALAVVLGIGVGLWELSRHRRRRRPAGRRSPSPVPRARLRT
jgi:hypothetical protein